LRVNNTFLGPWRGYLKENNLTEIPFSNIMTKEVEDYMVESYKKQGFKNSKLLSQKEEALAKALANIFKSS
jgi:hypothetical protein